MRPPGLVSFLPVAAALAAAIGGLRPALGDNFPRPSYRGAVRDPAYATEIVRIADDPGRPTGSVDGHWGRDARHVYSRQQPWSADQSLYLLENRKDGEPSPLFLDGTTFEPKLGPCDGFDLWEYRWHPSRAHAHELIGVNKEGSLLSWLDVITGRVTRSWKLPIEVRGIGSGEGSPSADGRFVALGDDSRVFVVDMDPQPPYPPYPAPRVGPVYRLPPCDEPECRIGNLSISPSGRYVDVKYSTKADSTRDLHRILEVDPATLMLRPHVMATASLRCGSFARRIDGYVFPLKHADLALDPFDHDEDVLVGGRSCPGARLGRVIKVRLRDGRVTALTDPRDEASVSHVSTRNLERPGWAYVTYFPGPGKRFSDEIVAVKLDGSGMVERWGRTRTASEGCYRCEAHAVPSPDGRRVAFASNWSDPGGPIEDYVLRRPDASASPRSDRSSSRRR